jgi:hypothetical protein
MESFLPHGANAACKARDLVARDLAHRLRRRALVKPSAGKILARGDDAVRRDDGMVAHRGAVEDRRALADDAAVTDGARMHETEASYRDVVPDRRAEDPIDDVNARALAEERVATHADRLPVRAQRGERPQDEISSGGEAADHCGAGCDVVLAFERDGVVEVRELHRCKSRTPASRGRCPTGS